MTARVLLLESHVRCLQEKPAAPRHGVPSVETQVHEHAINLARIGLYQPKVGGAGCLHRYPRVNGPAEKAQGLGNGLIEVEGSELKLALAGETEELAHQLGGAPGGLFNRRQRLKGRLRLRCLGEQERNI